MRAPRVRASPRHGGVNYLILQAISGNSSAAGAPVRDNRKLKKYNSDCGGAHPIFGNNKKIFTLKCLPITFKKNGNDQISYRNCSTKIRR